MIIQVTLAILISDSRVTAVHRLWTLRFRISAPIVDIQILKLHIYFACVQIHRQKLIAEQTNKKFSHFMESELRGHVAETPSQVPVLRRINRIQTFQLYKFKLASLGRRKLLLNLRMDSF